MKPKGILTRNGPGEFEMQSCVYHLQTPESDGNHFENQASKISCYHVIHQVIPQDREFLFNGDGIECSIIHAKSPGIVPFFHQQHIFRLKYYDPTSFPIHIPTRNEDNFIRQAYYGGHVDVYKPFGKNLFYYDINSLYPFIMKNYPMPCGKAVWYKYVDIADLEDKLGFIEANVVCPKNLNKPFLPYRDAEGTLIFGTGEFVGVYYSDELKYARDLG